MHLTSLISDKNYHLGDFAKFLGFGLKKHK